jgi:nucleoside-diphosphate-sugar epimerase
MTSEQTVLLLGATGRTGGRVLEQLLRRGVRVRVLVRSAERLGAYAAGDPNLTVVVADLSSLTDEDLVPHVRDCYAVVSCLGHGANLRGVFGSPRDLVTGMTREVCRAIQAVRPAQPVRLVLMSSVSVNHPGGLDTRRGSFEKGVVRTLRSVVGPAKDNQRAADFLYRDIGIAGPYVQWVTVRPDSLLEGDDTPYALHENLVSSLFRPDKTNRARVAHFMCELATDSDVWAAWQGKLPVIVNASPPDDSRGGVGPQEHS